MEITLAIVVVFLVGLLIRFVASLIVRVPRVPAWLKGVVILVGIIGGLLSVVSSSHLTSALERRDWPTAPGVITSSGVLGERAFHPEIEFEFSVGDSVYTASTNLDTPGFGGKRKKLDVAEAWVEEYPPGRAVMIHYNPDDLSEAFIKIAPPWNEYFKTGFGLFLVLATGFVLVLPQRRKLNSIAHPQ